MRHPKTCRWQLLRLSLFQVSVGMATVLLLGTLNRVMIVELSVPAIVVAR
jgi:MFS transporter, BCD family, chlorophyll transporter